MSPDKDFNALGPPSPFTRMAGIFIGFSSRLLVHCTSLVLAVIVSVSANLPGFGAASSVMLFFCLYIGLICLVPKGISLRPGWLVPTCSGLLLIICWQLSGFSWQLSIIWGGALTWVIRLLMQRGAIDWEWSAIPALAVAIFGFFNVLLPRVAESPPWSLFAVLAVAGLAANYFYIRFIGNMMQARTLRQTCSRLEHLAAGMRLPCELAPITTTLAAQGRELLALESGLNQSTTGLTEALEQIAGKLAGQGRHLTPAATAGVKAQLERMSHAMAERLGELAAAREHETPKHTEERALAARLETFRAARNRLADKRHSLPVELQPHIDGIALGADKIIRCMQDDPGDVARGDRFLSRYLESTHTIVDEYARLSAQGGEYSQVAESLARAKVLLARIEAAFVAEHTALLRNDTVNFTAELNVLDKLLRMDGK